MRKRKKEGKAREKGEKCIDLGEAARSKRGILPGAIAQAGAIQAVKPGIFA